MNLQSKSLFAFIDRLVDAITVDVLSTELRRLRRQREQLARCRRLEGIGVRDVA